MNLPYFIYFVLYVVAMTLIFGLSAMMLVPRFRTMFKAPVPSIHNIIGVCLIPWGLSYLLFLPDFYLSMNGSPWRDHAYVVVSMLTTIICFSATVWSYVVLFQQRVRQSVMQPLILTLPVATMLWYAFQPTEWLLSAFMIICFVEVAALTLYIIRLYRAFVADIKANYSSVSSEMLHCIWTLWGSTLFAFVFFYVAVALDEVLWNVVDIFINLLVLCVFIRTSEHLMPLPEEPAEKDTASDALRTADKPALNIRKALLECCEEPLLFCNPELSLQDLALAIGTNRTYLSRWFVEHDTTFYNYINGLRIDYAGHLLLSTDYAVTLIQLKSGFVNKSTFRKYFMDRYGCTPSEYRKAK